MGGGCSPGGGQDDGALVVRERQEEDCLPAFCWKCARHLAACPVCSSAHVHGHLAVPSALPLLCSVPVFRAFKEQSLLTHADLGLCAVEGVSRWLRAAGCARAEQGLATCAEAEEAANRAEAGRAGVALLWLERAHAGTWSMDDSSSCTANMARVRLICCWLCSAMRGSHIHPPELRCLQCIATAMDAAALTFCAAAAAALRPLGADPPQASRQKQQPT